MPRSRPPEEREQALALFTQHGAAEAARQTGIPERTIYDWTKEAGLSTPADPQKNAALHAANADRVQRTWADFRENEALSAGAAANRVRRALLTAVDERAHTEARSLGVVYGILIDKAELLSGQASQRIEVWAQTEIDVELRGLILKMEDSIRERSPTT